MKKKIEVARFHCRDCFKQIILRTTDLRECPFCGSHNLREKQLSNPGHIKLKDGERI